MNVRFLSLSQILAIHANQIKLYGGSLGLRDPGLLESALSQPSLNFGGEYAHPTLHEMAAAYLFHLAQNHPFHDGNKRVAVASAIIFLKANGMALTASNEDFEALVLSVARSETKKPEIAEFFRRSISSKKRS